MRDVPAREDSLHPFRSGLFAGDEALSAEDAGDRVDVTCKSVGGDDVGGLVIPRTVLAPVGRGYLLPRVVEGV